MTGIEIGLAVSAATAVVGGMVSAMGAMQQAEAQRKSANYNIAVAERNQQIAINQAAADAGDAEMENRRQLGAIRAAYGASGLALEGTPLDVLEATAIEQQLNVEKIRYKGRIGALDEGDRIEQFKLQRDAASAGAAFGVAGSLLKGLGGAASSGYGFMRGGGGGVSLSRGISGAAAP